MPLMAWLPAEDYLQTDFQRKGDCTLSYIHWDRCLRWYLATWLTTGAKLVGPYSWTVLRLWWYASRIPSIPLQYGLSTLPFWGKTTRHKWYKNTTCLKKTSRKHPARAASVLISWVCDDGETEEEGLSHQSSEWCYLNYFDLDTRVTRVEQFTRPLPAHLWNQTLCNLYAVQ